MQVRWLKSATFDEKRAISKTELENGTRYKRTVSIKVEQEVVYALYRMAYMLPMR